MKNLFILIYTIILFVFLQNISSAQSIEVDKTMGYEYAQEVIREMGVYQDENLTKYINNVGQKLVSNLDEQKFKYQFFVVPNIEPNAFALPGGYIFITTGLLPIIQTEDELACIMAHEIIHSQNRHTISQLKKGILPRLLEVPGNLLGILSKDLEIVFNTPIRTTNTLYMASYGRKKETESDLEGMELAAKSGYHPEALKDILNRMSQSIELVTGETEQKSYFNDHPYTPDRINAINLQASFLEKEPYNNVAHCFYKNEIDGLLFGESALKGVFNEQTFLHPSLNFKVTFPEEWNTINQEEYVGAYNPKMNEGLILIIEKEKDIMESALSFMEGLTKEEKSLMTSKGYFAFQNTQGYEITFEGEFNKEKKYARVGWIKLNNVVYKVTNFSHHKEESSFEKVITSLSILDEKDFQQIKTHKIRIVEAKESETLEHLLKRTNNCVNVKLVAVLNDIQVSKRLKKGQLIKIIKSYSFNTEVEIMYNIKPSR